MIVGNSTFSYFMIILHNVVCMFEERKVDFYIRIKQLVVTKRCNGSWRKAIEPVKNIDVQWWDDPFPPPLFLMTEANATSCSACGLTPLLLVDWALCSTKWVQIVNDQIHCTMFNMKRLWNTSILGLLNNCVTSTHIESYYLEIRHIFMASINSLDFICVNSNDLFKFFLLNRTSHLLK